MTLQTKFPPAVAISKVVDNFMASPDAAPDAASRVLYNTTLMQFHNHEGPKDAKLWSDGELLGALDEVFVTTFVAAGYPSWMFSPTDRKYKVLFDDYIKQCLQSVRVHLKEMTAREAGRGTALSPAVGRLLWELLEQRQHSTRLPLMTRSAIEYVATILLRVPKAIKEVSVSLSLSCCLSCRHLSSPERLGCMIQTRDSPKGVPSLMFIAHSFG